MTTSVTDSVEQDRRRHPRTLALGMLLFLIPTSVVGAIIGLQLVTTLGLVPNTAFIGVVVAIGLSRLPMFRRLRSIHSQNLIQSNISTATFVAAASLMVPLTLAVISGHDELVGAVVLGAIVGMVVDLMMLYWLFDSKAFPAGELWPPGAAAAEALIAGDRGGRRALTLLGGAGVGAAGAWAGVPMLAFAVAFLGNAVALTMFAVGLLASSYLPQMTGIDLVGNYIPHGVLIGAGLAALGQAAYLLTRRDETSTAEDHADASAATESADDAMRETVEVADGNDDSHTLTRSNAFVGKALGRGVALYVVGGAAVALVAGLWTSMSMSALIAWVAYAVAACLASQFIVGLSAMHAGWFPAFGTSLLFLTLGVALGFPIPALVALGGLLISGGPAFADSGYDLKAGWVVRGRGKDVEFELEGRRQQLLAGLVGMAVSLVVVLLVFRTYIDNGLVPPIARVYEATLSLGTSPEIVRDLAIWAIPGALIQVLGGPKRQMGVLLGTGLLLVNPAAGWAVSAGLVLRFVWKRWFSRRLDEETVTVIASGMIAGDAIYGFANSAVSAARLKP